MSDVNDEVDEEEADDGTFLFQIHDVVAKQQKESEKCHYMVVVEGEDLGLRIEIGHDPVTIGRSNKAMITLNDRGISKVHCSFELKGMNLFVEDLNSTNGTHLGGVRVDRPVVVPIESRVQIGQHVLKHEYRLREDVEETSQITEDISKAANYVMSILPEPFENEHLSVDWTFLPSVYLGGDAFGYDHLDDDHYSFYLIDVCGHGAGAAMHSVSVINSLRSKAIPNVDFKKPGEVLTQVNTMFNMEKHGNLYFSMWYGVYNTKTKMLTYASGGHPPSILVKGDGAGLDTLKTKGLGIGTMPGYTFKSSECEMAPDDVLYIFSDGAFEVQTTEGEEWSIKQFQEALLETKPLDGKYSPAVKKHVEEITGTDKWEDDFSLIAIKFR